VSVPSSHNSVFRKKVIPLYTVVHSRIVSPRVRLRHPVYIVRSDRKWIALSNSPAEIAQILIDVPLDDINWPRKSLDLRCRHRSLSPLPAFLSALGYELFRSRGYLVSSSEVH